MTEDPKNLPAWLRKDSGKQEPKREPPPPPPSDPPEGDAGDEESLPPWLREDAPMETPPATSGLRRLAPRPEDDDQGDVPPWLRGMDEPKTYSIGGTELSEEYLSGGDELADSDDSELTFDLWMAQQTESKREKDIEEEVPDLLSAIEDDKETPAPPATGQLPDWFLGLEELDTSDAPEWFNADDKPATGALGNEPPPWISDMVGEPDKPTEPPAQSSAGAPADDIVSFFDSLAGSLSAAPPSADDDDEGEPDLNWLMEQPPLDTGDLPVDDFFTEASGEPEAESAVPDWFYQPSDAVPSADDPFAADPFAEPPDDFDDVDADAEVEDAHAEPAVEIPQNELDAFFDNLAAGRAATQEELDDIEEPDLAWFVSEEPAEEPEPVEDEIPDPEIFSEDDENTLSWLNELGSIVSSASRSSEPYRPEPTPSFTDDIPDEVWQTTDEVPGPELDWDNLPGSTEPSADAGLEEDWLSGIAPDPDAEANYVDGSDTLPLVPTGLLSHREQTTNAAPSEPEPDPEPIAEPEAADFEWEDAVQSIPESDPVPEPEAADFEWEDAAPEAVPEVDEAESSDNLIPTDELNSGWLTDDLLAEAEFSDDLTAPEAASVADEADDEYLQALAQEDLFAESDNAVPADDDFLSALRMDVEADDQARTPVTSTDDLPQWGDQADDDLVDYEPPTTDDLYAALGMSTDDEQPSNEEAAAVPDLFGQWNDQAEEQPADDLYGQWSDQPEDESAYDMPTTGDLFAQLGMNADNELPSEEEAAAAPDLFGQWSDQAEDEQPADDEGAVPDDLYGQWSDQAEDDESAAAYDLPTTGDLFAQLGMDADNELPSEEEAAAAPDLFGQWSDQVEDEQPADDEGAVPDDLYGQWSDQAEDDESAYDMPTTGDLFAQLGMDADNELPSEEEEAAPDLFGQWSDQAQDEQPADDEGAVPDDLYGQWSDQADDDESAYDLPNTGDLFAEVSTDVDDEQPVDDEGAVPDDLFGQWNDQADDEQPVDDESAVPDDLFGQWNDQPDEEVSLEEGFYAALQARDQQPKSPERAQDEFLSKWETEAEMPPEDEFFEALGMISNQDAAPEPSSDDDAEPDFFEALGMIDSDQPPAERAPTSEFGDIEGYLASLSSEQPKIEPITDEIFNESPDDIDLDALFSAPVLADQPPPPSGIDTTPGMNEAWLAELQASVGEVSASAIVRQKEDRPVDELPDRLKRLRQRAESVAEQAPAAPSAGTGALDDVLPGGAAGLVPAPFVASMTMLPSVSLTPDQQQKVDLLKALTPSSVVQQAARMSAIDMTYDSPFMPVLEDSAENIVHPERQRKAAPARSRRRLRLGWRLDRLLIAVVLAAALIAPFLVPSLRFGDLPPQVFPAGSAAQVAFEQVDKLPSGALVLVGIEYEPTAAAELDGMTDALVRHILLRAAYPVLVGTNPIGILRAENLMASINADADFLARIHAPGALEANRDYYIVRYLPGSVIGLRAFSAGTANLLLTDIRGQATDLRVRSFTDFALVAVVTDRAEDLRGYAEQIAPLTDAPLVAAVSYGAAPLAQPYAETFGGGLLVGYQDAYTYGHALDDVRARSIAQRVRIVPTDTPTPVPSNLPGAEATAEATVEPDFTPGGPTPVKLLGTATVISTQSVNMRSGPGTDNTVIAGVPSGTRVDVIGFDASQTWVNVRLTNGQTGWIAATLLDVQRTSSARPLPERFTKRLAQTINPDQPTDVPTNAPSAQSTDTPAGDTTAEAEATASPTRTPTRRPTSTASATPRATSTPAVTATPEVTVEAVAGGGGFTLPPHSDGYQDERWWALNSGIIASVLIISFGTVINVGRGLLRRGRRR